MSKLKGAEKLYNSLRKKIVAIKTKFKDKYDDDHAKIVDSPEYKALLKKKLTREEKNLLEEERSSAYNSGELELFLPFKKNKIQKVKGVRRKVMSKRQVLDEKKVQDELDRIPPGGLEKYLIKKKKERTKRHKAEIEKGLGRTLTEREKQYLKSDSDLNPKNFYKGGVVDIVDAGKYFKHKPKK